MLLVAEEGEQKVLLLLEMELLEDVVVEQVDMVVDMLEEPVLVLLVEVMEQFHHQQVGEILVVTTNIILHPIIMVVEEVVVPDLLECLEKLQPQFPHKVI